MKREDIVEEIRKILAINGKDNSYGELEEAILHRLETLGVRLPDGLEKNNNVYTVFRFDRWDCMADREGSLIAVFDDKKTAHDYAHHLDPVNDKGKCDSQYGIYVQTLELNKIPFHLEVDRIEKVIINTIEKYTEGNNDFEYDIVDLSDYDLENVKFKLEIEKVYSSLNINELKSLIKKSLKSKNIDTHVIDIFL
jgi:hypothetical protein